MHELRPATPDTDGYAALLRESLSEGHQMLRRLEENWRSGANTFSRRGEMLLGAFSDRELVGVCGCNVDPYEGDATAGRVRHLYVRPDRRRHGVGRLLVGEIARSATAFFDRLQLRAPEDAFRFYESLGFARVRGEESVTHRLLLRPRGPAFTRA